MIKEFDYTPIGTCSKEMHFVLDENNIIKDFTVIGGCNGNLKGIRSLIIGMKASDVIDKLDGTLCKERGTSCPDQIAKALKEHLGK